MTTVRDERPEDVSAIRRVIEGAFGQADEADLVERIRHAAAASLALVAQTMEGDDSDRGRIVGHILFSPVTIDDGPHIAAVGLAPLAVQPERQRQGIGTALVAASLDRCRGLGIQAVVVLGHPEYYPRFGFRPARRFGLSSDYDVPPDAFMALELASGALECAKGVVHYHAAFDSL